MMECNYQHHLPIGSELAEYRIEKILGEGGFGVTYLATDLNLHKQFAIKEYLPGDFAVRTDNSTVVPKSQTEGENFKWGLDRFLDEARTLATFKHPNLNQVQRFFKANGTAYMVLEYVEGETLSTQLKRNPVLAETELSKLLKCLLGGLEVVHQAGYTHRDIKPGNIMIKPDGTPVLLDFGAARQALGYKSKSLTAILTPGYAPIEQYATKADDIGAWTDIYSLGIVAYQCACGCKTDELVDSVTRSGLQRKGQHDKDLPSVENAGKGRFAPELLRGINWAIQVNEEDRPQSVEAWCEVMFTPVAQENKPSPPTVESVAPVKVPPEDLDEPKIEAPPTLEKSALLAYGLQVFFGAGLLYVKPRLIKGWFSTVLTLHVLGVIIFGISPFPLYSSWINLHVCTFALAWVAYCLGFSEIKKNLSGKNNLTRRPLLKFIPEAFQTRIMFWSIFTPLLIIGTLYAIPFLMDMLGM